MVSRSTLHIRDKIVSTRGTSNIFECLGTALYVGSEPENEATVAFTITVSLVIERVRLVDQQFEMVALKLGNGSAHWLVRQERGLCHTGGKE